MRHALITALAAIAFLSPRVVSAQSCHVARPRDPLEDGVRLALVHETARFESSRYEGHFQGLMLSGSVTQRWFSVTAVLPAYRVVRNGLPSRGLGDLVIHSQALLAHTSNERLWGGLALGAMLPTGDERKELGMGHTMLMPGVWAAGSAGDLRGSMQIAYAQAVSSNDTDHRHGAGPIVAPMNASELEAALFAALPIHVGFPGLTARIGADGAVPVLDADGSARANARVGILLGDRVRTSFELAWPITGEPSVTRLVLELGIALP